MTEQELYRRHGELVDKMYDTGLTLAEQQEFDDVRNQLHAIQEDRDRKAAEASISTSGKTSDSVPR